MNRCWQNAIQQQQVMRSIVDKQTILHKTALQNQWGRCITKTWDKRTFNNLSDEKKNQYEAGAERMNAMLVNIDELIPNSLNQTNGTVSWETIAMMIAGDFSIQIQNAIQLSEASNKQTNQHQDQCAYWFFNSRHPWGILIQ